MTDYHSHCLPCVDDGAASTDVSIQLLSLLKKQGVDRVFLTPHFLSGNSVDSFLDKRNESFRELSSAISTLDLPTCKLGAEVNVFHGVSELDGLKKLNYEGTDKILLELPFAPYGRWISDEIDGIISNTGYSPVFAHIERYFSLYKLEDFIYYYSFKNVIYQFGVSSLVVPKIRRCAYDLIDNGINVVFGSDAHNMSNRKPEFNMYNKFILKKKRTQFDFFD